MEAAENLDLLFPDSDLLESFPERGRLVAFVIPAHPAGKGDLTLMRLHVFGAASKQEVRLSVLLEHRHQHRRLVRIPRRHPAQLELREPVSDFCLNRHLFLEFRIQNREGGGLD